MLECSRNKSFEILACISDKPDTRESCMSIPMVLGDWGPRRLGPKSPPGRAMMAIPKQQLKIHKPSKHDETKYSCDQCDYKTKNRSSLNFLKQSKHEGINHL